MRLLNSIVMRRWGWRGLTQRLPITAAVLTAAVTGGGMLPLIASAEPVTNTAAQIVAIVSPTSTTETQTPGAVPSDLKLAYQRPKHIPFPDSNPYSPEKADLGRMLFFDTRLSRDGDMSCASCHDPTQRWSDDRKIPLGAENVPFPRRSPTVLDSAWRHALMWDGRADTLEAQALLPLTTEHEMNMTVPDLHERLASIPEYRERFDAAFNTGGAIDIHHVQQALATFQRTVVSPRTDFDRWVEGDEQAISRSAQRGFLIFNDKAQCAACHTSWRFTDDSFHDIGLTSLDMGRGEHVPAEVVTMQYAFKTPTLRELPAEGWFMHDGSMGTLNEVIEHYEQGGEPRPSLSHEMKPFELTSQERQDLLTFLATLRSDPG